MAELKWITNGGNYYYFGSAPIHISSITLDKSSISLSIAGQTEQLTATVSPDEAVEKKVNWSSSDLSVAIVNQTGLVTCVAPGMCTITAECDGISATCNVFASNIYTEILLVGTGGDGGGGYCLGGGGGGAGGLIYCDNYQLSQLEYYITVGTREQKDSCFDGLIAYGGGNGLQGRGLSGGSGGGGGGCGRCDGGDGCSGQGNSGGGSYPGSAGGGGGYCCAGSGASSQNNGGAGGCGFYSDISGEGYWYASGGSGGGSYSNAGVCGGGAGGGGESQGGDATTCGSGGGGRGYSNNFAYDLRGGYGANGIFILRYLTSCGYNISGGCKYTCGNYTIHCFTSNGTLCIS